MDLNTLIEFPGILITIGVGLILISIIIILVAYRSEAKVVDVTKLSSHTRSEDNFQNNVPVMPLEEPVNQNIVVEPQLEENLSINTNESENENLNEKTINEVLNANMENLDNKKEEVLDNPEENMNFEIPLVDEKIADISVPEKEDVTEILPTINAFDLEFNNNEYSTITNKEKDIKKEVPPEKEEPNEEDIEQL